MAELILCRKLDNINKLFPTSKPHRQISRPCNVRIKKMQFTYISVIESFGNNCPTCDNITTGSIVFLNCGMWLQGESVVGK